MANVDRCIRECEKALCSDLEKYSRNILEITNGERVAVLRNKNFEEIKTILNNCKKSIQIKIANDYYIDVNFEDINLEKGSSNNKIGADIFHKLPDDKIIDIEVKFGLETDKQIGMEQFSIIFGTNIFSKSLDLNTRKSWLESFKIEDNADAKQSYRLFLQLNQAVDSFNLFNKNKNYTLTSDEQSHMESLIINNSGDETKTGSYYLKFIIEGDDMKDIKQLPTGLGKWNIDEVKKLSQAIKRVNVYVINKTTNIQIKYTLNWKNNYPVSNKGKVSAKLGLGSPSWNVWITVDVSELS